MNRSQMKSAIAKFKSADVSIIKDDALRAKAQKLQAKQQGFTLLELLVVITLIATLATAGLVAYEGLGENAQDAAAAKNIIFSESSTRNFRAVENQFPNQWDNLANLDGTGLFNDGGTPNDDSDDTAATGAVSLLAEPTQTAFGQWIVATGTATATWNAVADAFNEVGINELQTLQAGSTFNPGNVPNLAFNESNPSANLLPADEFEFEEDGTAEYGGSAVTTFALSIFPSGGTAGVCTADGVDISTSFDGTAPTNSAALNLINDNLDDNGCHLVAALGFGKDVPGTTTGSRVSFSQAPTAGTDDINPANNYARLVALYHLGSADGTATDVTSTDIFENPRLIGFVDAEGRNLDQVIAAANESDLADDD